MRTQLPIDGMEAQGPIKPVTSRAQLAAEAKQDLGVDLLPLWAWLQKKGGLPTDLPENWDPIGGELGAVAHLGGSDHQAVPPALAPAVNRANTPSEPGDLAPTGQPARQCKVCGAMRVVAQCWSAVQGREVKYMETFAATLAELAEEVKSIGDRYSAAMQGFGDERTRHFKLDLERMMATVSHDEMRKALVAMAAAPTPYTSLRAGNPAAVMTSLNEAGRGLAVLRDEILSEARNDGRPQYRLAGKGRQAEPLTEFWAMLKEASLSYREIAEALPDGGPIEDGRQRVIDRLKPRTKA